MTSATMASEAKQPDVSRPKPKPSVGAIYASAAASSGLKPKPKPKPTTPHQEDPSLKVTGPKGELVLSCLCWYLQTEIKSLSVPKASVTSNLHPTPHRPRNVPSYATCSHLPFLLQSHPADSPGKKLSGRSKPPGFKPEEDELAASIYKLQQDSNQRLADFDKLKACTVGLWAVHQSLLVAPEPDKAQRFPTESPHVRQAGTRCPAEGDPGCKDTERRAGRGEPRWMTAACKRSGNIGLP